MGFPRNFKFFHDFLFYFLFICAKANELLGLSRGLSGAALGASWAAFGVPGDAPGVVLGAFCASFEGFERKS